MKTRSDTQTFSTWASGSNPLWLASTDLPYSLNHIKLSEKQLSKLVNLAEKQSLSLCTYSQKRDYRQQLDRIRRAGFYVNIKDLFIYTKSSTFNYIIAKNVESHWKFINQFKSYSLIQAKKVFFEDNLYYKQLQLQLILKEFAKAKKLWYMLHTPAEGKLSSCISLRNNCVKAKQDLEYFEELQRRSIFKDYELHNKLNENNPKYPPKLTSKRISQILFKEEFQQYQKLAKLRERAAFTEIAYDNAQTYIKRFERDGIVVYLQNAINLIKTANFFGLGLSCKSTYTEYISYFSRNKWCPYSNKFKTIIHETQLVNTLRYYRKRNYGTSFLTLKPTTLEHEITKEDVLNAGEIMHRFFQHPEIKEVFHGYYSVPEVVFHEKGTPVYHRKKKTGETYRNDCFNLHFHIMCLRKLKYSEGYIPQKRLEEIFRHVASVYGNEKLKDSFYAYIEAPDIRNEDKQLGAVRYIHQYITKGFKVEDMDAKIQCMDAFEGVRMQRSGGLLLDRQQKDVATIEHIEKKIEEMFKYDQAQLSFKIDDNWDRNRIALATLFEEKPEDIIKKLVRTTLNANTKGIDKLLGVPSLTMPREYVGCKTQFFQNIKKELFDSVKFKCPVTQEKLLFSHISQRIAPTDPREPLFLVEALRSQGLTEKAEQFHRATFGVSEVEMNLLNAASHTFDEYLHYCRSLI